MSIENINKIELHFDSSLDSRLQIKKEVLIAYKKNKAFFKCDLMHKCKIFLLYKREEMDKIQGRKTELWLVGTARENSIYIFSPVVFYKVSNHVTSNFSSILTHELAHIFTDEIYKFYQPFWLKEGVAGYIAEQYRNKQPKTINAFENLHERKDWNNNPNYTQASCFTAFLVKKFGKNKFLQFLKILSEDLNSQKKFTIFSKLFSRYFGTSFKQIVQIWQKKVPPKKILERH